MVIPSCANNDIGYGSFPSSLSADLNKAHYVGVHHPLGRDEGEHCVHVQGMYGGGEVGGRTGRP